jgi:hypothetical protein
MSRLTPREAPGLSIPHWADIGGVVKVNEEGLVCSRYDYERKRWVPVESQTREVCWGEGLSERVRERRTRQGRKGVTRWP